jgi:putative transposase
LKTLFPHSPSRIRSRYRITLPELPHFVTSTVVEWLPVFTSSDYCDILVRSLLHCREHKGLKIYAWVILDNHFHAILAGPELARTIADLKKFSAHEVLRQLEIEVAIGC